MHIMVHRRARHGDGKSTRPHERDTHHCLYHTTSPFQCFKNTEECNVFSGKLKGERRNAFRNKRKTDCKHYTKTIYALCSGLFVSKAKSASQRHCGTLAPSYERERERRREERLKDIALRSLPHFPSQLPTITATAAPGLFSGIDRDKIV
jgi:hypothetical protein